MTVSFIMQWEGKKMSEFTETLCESEIVIKGGLRSLITIICLKAVQAMSHLF
jgi:hypothetical protein